MRYWSLLIIICSVGNFACSNSKEKCQDATFKYYNETYKAKGCFIDSLEDGNWSFWTGTNKIIEAGTYDRGLRIGKWHYYGNRTDSIINRKKHHKENLELNFNVPELLFKVEEDSSYIKFSNKDSLNLFNLVLAVKSLDKINVKVEEYQKIGEKEIKENGWKYTSTNTRLVTKGQPLYFNVYRIQTSEGGDFSIFDIYKEMKNGRLLEISCRCSKETEATARIVFFSTILNCFYENERFMDPFEKVAIDNSI
jgi:hypothetical protein